jgi:hypothetical protein
VELKQDPNTGWWVLGTGPNEGYGITRLHNQELCKERGCAMHNHPSFHPLFDAPLRWNGVLDRKCQHGIWHADKDEVLYYESIGSSRFCEDNCDNCCKDWDVNGK